MPRGQGLDWFFPPFAPVGLDRQFHISQSPCTQALSARFMNIPYSLRSNAPHSKSATLCPDGTRKTAIPNPGLSSAASPSYAPLSAPFRTRQTNASLRQLQSASAWTSRIFTSLFPPNA